MPGGPVIAHGVDLVEVPRIAAVIERHESRFLDRTFTHAELAYADANPKRRTEHLAARFAAKEAVFKALGTGWARGIAWTDCEVTRSGEGRPGVALTGKAAKIAEALGVVGWLLSLSHTESVAMASVIGFGDNH